MLTHALHDYSLMDDQDVVVILCAIHHLMDDIRAIATPTSISASSASFASSASSASSLSHRHRVLPRSRTLLHAARVTRARVTHVVVVVIQRERHRSRHRRRHRDSRSNPRHPRARRRAAMCRSISTSIDASEPGRAENSLFFLEIRRSPPRNRRISKSVDCTAKTIS